jgi:hypothetical protein
MLLKTEKFVNACLRCCKLRICPEKLRGTFEGSPGEKKKTCKNWLALAKTCDKLAPIAACIAIN